MITKLHNKPKNHNKMETNSLTFNTSKVFGTEAFSITIKLADECHNGHEHFSITGCIYEAGKLKTDKYLICSGAIGDKIAKVFPQYAIFDKLHLSDQNGVPMYAVENGFYHLKNGFNSKPTGDDFKTEFCDYYRISPDQFDIISQSENTTEYAILLNQMGITKQWKEEANEAIKILESLTGNTFKSEAKMPSYKEPTKKEIDQFIDRKKSGYYSPENKAKRALEAKEHANNKLISELKERASKEIKEIKTELNIKLYLISIGVDIDNVIYYNHSNELAFNWKNFGKQLSENEFNAILKQIDISKLPDGIKIINKQGK